MRRLVAAAQGVRYVFRPETLTNYHKDRFILYFVRDVFHIRNLKEIFPIKAESWTSFAVNNFRISSHYKDRIAAVQ